MNIVSGNNYTKSTIMLTCEIAVWQLRHTAIQGLTLKAQTTLEAAEAA